MARILVIDDEPDILDIIELTLASKGHQVVASHDPTRVAELARKHHADAVILDIMMPGFSGYDALRALRDQPQTGGVPILFLSARAESEDRVRGLKEGADDYMTKPFDVEELALRIERLVGPRIAASTISSSSNLKQTLDERRVVGQVFLGRYQALEVIGEGAMGLVFRGWDPRLKRAVALKTLHLEKLLDAENRDTGISQLLHEAITAARFSHPNIVAVYDAEAGPEVAYVAMEFVDGTTLTRYLRLHGKLPPQEVVLLALGIARGLAAAHEHHIVHHDVKPSNVLLGREATIKVSDFGLAHLVHTLASAADTIFGTPGYLPPEALQGEGYDERGDLFALGAVLYECLTGERAFGGSTSYLRIFKTVNQQVVPPHDLVPSVPAALEDLVLELLRKNPAARPESAAEVVARLAALTDRELRWQPDLSPRVLAEQTFDSESTLLTREELTLALSKHLDGPD